ncbi:tyrosine-protein phosphatase [Myceligenerans crystallogenes]|uniref:protein-tyrosine-phosphatase n=1 Tax=Myceligenerans crystallogenes TaxID=316335 RepID=A0ABN2NJ70_9MICO
MPTYSPLHLDWPGLLNARDLGGMPLSGGGVVAERAIVRAESFSWLRPDGVEAARAYGLGRIIDLRLPAETVRYPHPFADEPDVYVNLPVQEPDDPEEGPWAHLYEGMLERRPKLFARAVGAVADAPEGPVAVHCAAGKDRTGLVVAFTLSLAGADDALIADDYELTSTRLAPREAGYAAVMDRARAAHEEARAARRAAGEQADGDDDLPVWLHPARRIAVTRDIILETLAYVRSAYGSIGGYLEGGGLTAAQQEKLVRRVRGEI